MPRSRRLKLYEYVAELVEEGSAVLCSELALPAERSHDVMLLVAKAICFRQAKSTVYIPEAANLANIERNARIWAEYQVDSATALKFTPARASELAAKYDLSPQQIYNVLRGEREAEVATRQGQLPGVDSAA